MAQLTRAEEENKLQLKYKQLKADLAEAGSPASLTVEVIGGGLSGWGATRGIYKVLDALLKTKPGETPGFLKKNKEFVKGCVAGGAGLVTGGVNIAFPYKYPMSYPRAMALQGSITMMTSGLDRIVDFFPGTAPPALSAGQ